MTAIKGKGTILQCEFVPPTYTTISNRVTIDGPSMEVSTAETTHLDSTWREHIPTIPSGGEVSMEIEYDPAETTHSSLTDLVSTPEVKNWKITFTDSAPTSYDFAGILTSFEVGGIEVDGIVTASIGIQVTGAVTIA